MTDKANSNCASRCMDHDKSRTTERSDTSAFSGFWLYRAKMGNTPSNMADRRMAPVSPMSPAPIVRGRHRKRLRVLFLRPLER